MPPCYNRPSTSWQPMLTNMPKVRIIPTFFCCCFTSSHQYLYRSPQLPVAIMIYFAFVLRRAILAAVDAPADPGAGAVCLVWSSSIVFPRRLCYLFIWNHSCRCYHRSPYFHGVQLYRRCFLRDCLCLRGYCTLRVSAALLAVRSARS